MSESFRWLESAIQPGLGRIRAHRTPDRNAHTNEPERRERRDYSVHDMKRGEQLVFLVKCVGVVILFAWFFYRSIWAMLPLSVLGIWYGKVQLRSQASEDRRQLLLQFCDMLQAVSASLRAGYSVENAFLESYDDMRMMHGEGAMICRELRLLKRGLEMNLTLEALLTDLGKRSHVPQIREFSSVFSIGYRSSGNLSQIIQNATEVMYRNAEVREEIWTQTAARRMERNIMSLMPFAILIYIEATSSGYFDMLYHNLTGAAVMTGCLITYLTAFLWSRQILERALDAEV